MQLHYTLRFREKFTEAPIIVQKAFLKQAGLLVENLRHPSLHAKKYDETNGLWQARVNSSWRFYFTIDGDTYTIRTMIPHPK